MTRFDPERSVRHLQELYTVVVGIALTVAISNLIDKDQPIPIRLSIFPYFVAYLFTLVPFYHGALRHLDKTYLEPSETAARSGALMLDWSLLFIESCLLLAIAILLQTPVPFSYALAFLLAFDMLWGFGAHLAFSTSAKPRYELRWGIINLVATVILISCFVFLDSIDTSQKPVSSYRWILVLTLSIARTIWDYSWCWSYYLPTSGKNT